MLANPVADQGDPSEIEAVCAPSTREHQREIILLFERHLIETAAYVVGWPKSKAARAFGIFSEGEGAFSMVELLLTRIKRLLRPTPLTLQYVSSYRVLDRVWG